MQLNEGTLDDYEESNNLDFYQEMQEGNQQKFVFTNGLMSDLDQSQSRIDNENNYTEFNEDMEFMIVVGIDKNNR